MTPETQRTADVLGRLKDFQRDTVEYAFNRLWGENDPVNRFLVADEVGLGKTMVARGLIAKAVEHLAHTKQNINIIYICSNGQIARQNLRRLNGVGGTEVRHADRLTLLPKAIKGMRDKPINFVSFTPGTSFNVGRSSGASPERVLLYWLLAVAWGPQVTDAEHWKAFFTGDMRQDRFEAELKDFDLDTLDDGLGRTFDRAIAAATGPGGAPLREELEKCAQEFAYLTGSPEWELRRRRDRLVGKLRQLVAKAAVDQLEPDLVILDEFQRFKDLLNNTDDGAQLASTIFEHPRAKTLLLSATPYKMYTLPDEPEGDDHYSDFVSTVRFLAGADRAHVVAQEMRTVRESMLSRDQAQAEAARDRAQRELRRVMSRTERLAATSSRNGMLDERELDGAQLSITDVRAWRALDDVAQKIGSHDVFEYWRSTPYPLNLMDHYQVIDRFKASVERNDIGARAALAASHGLLNWNEVHRYQQVDPGNAKMRGLMQDVLGLDTWRIAWISPSLPYYELSGVYAAPGVRDFTKRLVFSAWTVVPKAIAVLVSYEAERLAIKSSPNPNRDYGSRPIAPPLRFAVDATGRATGMPALALLYPSSVLAELGDPLEVARTTGSELPLSRELLHSTVRERVASLLAQLSDDAVTAGPVGSVDQRWYWAAPFLLDHALHPETTAAFPIEHLLVPDDDEDSHLRTHQANADKVLELDLGLKPDDLTEVVTAMAIAGPGICALRALSRVAGGAAALHSPEIRGRAYEIAHALRSLFNKPEIIAVLRSEIGPYWRSVLDHAYDGVLQSVLDEYVHVLIESEGLQEATADKRAVTVADIMTEALSIRTATNAVTDVQVGAERVELVDRRMSSHFAARYGRAESNDQAMMREGTVRTAYNSPFRPFVLASTSVGQEGLDFHTYSHAVVHWNLPSNPVDLEQREGRVHRYKGHAVRKNVAHVHQQAALSADTDDPWQALFAAAQQARAPGESDIKPFWVFTRPGGALIERYVPTLPLSRETQRHRRLLRTVGAYRSVIGQPRQGDLMKYVGEDVEWPTTNLTPPPRSG